MTDYPTAREALRQAELALMQQRETVAELRRSLPLGPSGEDYVFTDDSGDVRLSELFTDPSRSVVLYHFMFGGQQERACPMCAMWADGWSSLAGHLADRLDFAVVTSASVERTAELVAEKGWGDLRWLSAADSSFKLDIGGEDDEGRLSPFLSVWELTEGRPRMTYSGGANIVSDHWRGVDLLSPVWHFQDLTREGRGDWMPSLSY